MKKIVFLLIVTFAFVSVQTNAFELQEFDGTPVRLEDKIGNDKWTLVMFWAHHCGVCRAEMPTISEFHSRRADVEVVGISIDGEEDKPLALGFMDDTNPSFTSYITSLTLAAFNYQELTEEDFRGTPTFLLFTPKGELIGNNPGKMSIEALESFISKNS